MSFGGSFRFDSPVFYSQVEESESILIGEVGKYHLEVVERGCSGRGEGEWVFVGELCSTSSSSKKESKSKVGFQLLPALLPLQPSATLSGQFF